MATVLRKCLKKDRRFRNRLRIRRINTFKGKGIFCGCAKTVAVSKEKGLDYGVGDRVRHMKFGEGTVTQITEGGRDFEVTVEFDTAGVKKNVCRICPFGKIIEIM